MTYSIEGLSDAQKAVRLIYKGMRPKLSAVQDVEYSRLLDHYWSSSDFRLEVEKLARMMELVVIPSDNRKILLRPEGEGCYFAVRLADIRQSASELDRSMLALIFLAIGAAFFRTGPDLTRRDDRDPEFTAEQVEEVLNELCQKIEEENPADPDRTDEYSVKVWRRLLSRARKTEDEKRASMKSRLQMINLVLGKLDEYDMVATNTAGESISYVPTERFRQQLKDVLESEVYEKGIRMLGINTPRGEPDHDLKD